MHTSILDVDFNFNTMSPFHPSRVYCRVVGVFFHMKAQGGIYEPHLVIGRATDSDSRQQRLEGNPPLLHRRYLNDHRDFLDELSLFRSRYRMASAMEPPLIPVPVNGTNGHHDGLLEPPTQFDVSIFRSYLSALLPPVVGALPEELDDLFESGDFDETVSKFAAEGSDVVYVAKQRVDLEGSAIFAMCPPVAGCVFYDANF